MKLLQRISVEDIVQLEDVSVRTAKSEIKTLKAFYNVNRPRFYHYFMYNRIDYTEYQMMCKTLKA